MTSPIAPAGTLPLLLPRVSPEAAPVVPPAQEAPLTGSSAIPFVDLLSDAVAAANLRSNQANTVAQSFASGALDDIHGTMIATKEADIQLRLVGNVRNKIIDAFYELWRMNV